MIKVYQFTKPEIIERFLILYEREIKSKFHEVPLEDLTDVLRSLEHKEFMKVNYHPSGAIQGKLSEKGNEFASDHLPLN